jgi:hypothetical protein
MGIFLTDSNGVALTSDESGFVGLNLVDNSDELPAQKGTDVIIETSYDY